VVGAGPYGLSATAHLKSAGVSVHAFGRPMESWIEHMPSGMLLRSRWDASHIADPDHELGLGAYERAAGLERTEPVPLSRFVDYGRWFQANAVRELDPRRVSDVSTNGAGFNVEVEDGEVLHAKRVVVAAGPIPFARRPPQLENLSRELVSHASEHSDLGAFEGRRVAVVGGGQSALESAALLAENGAEVELLVRERDVRWLAHEDPAADTEPKLLDYAYRKTALGGRRSSWLVALPALVRRLPERTRKSFYTYIVRPAGAGWLKPRLSEVPITRSRAILFAEPHEGGLLLTVDDGSTRQVDHVLLATGYRVDLSRYGFLPPELVQRVRCSGGAPVLEAGFESSVPGLHFLGAPAARSFGPVMNFVCGTWASARGLTREIAGRRAPRASFSW
jgi:FAD-dependent urate hydroxylase